MKRATFLLYILLLCLSASADGKFRVIIFADTNDEKLGTGFDKNIELIQDELGVITSALDMVNDYEEDVYEQYECNSAKVKQVIQNFRCGPNDIVAFFYFGHGTRSAQDKSEFPQMCLGERDQSKFIPLEDVHNALVRKGGRFTLVMGDCCNNVAGPSITPKMGVLAAASSSEFSPTQKAAIRKLFLGSKGSLMISGSKKNEFSIYNTFMGGFMLRSFIEALEEHTSATSNPDWNICLNKMHDKVVEMSKETVRHHSDWPIQHPQWLNKVNGGGTPPQPNPNPNPKPVVKPGDLLSALTNIANDQNDRGYRINLRNKVLNEFFASNAKVETVGRNGTTSLSDESAKDFIARISTASRLRNFVIHEKRTDSSGRVIYLKLHEIYEAKPSNVSY